VHFAEGSWSVGEIPVERLVGPAVVVGVEEAAAADRDYLATVEDFRAWEAEHGRIPDGAIVLLRTGYGRFWPDREAYLGTDLTGPEAVPHLHFPGLHPDAARWLVDERRIHVFGLDTPSTDRGQSTDFLTHRVFGEANVPGLENVANLDRLPARGFTVVALPMKIAEGSGAPVRIVALLE
jgi:kynurenine formamidase